jgi:protoheme IX farnesyltransferase
LAPFQPAAPEDAVTTVDPRPGAAACPALSSTEPRTPASAGPRPARRRLAAFVALTKPRIIELLLVTTVPTMIFAAGGLPPLRLVVATLVGGTFAAGSANTLNCYLDRDIDGVMHRTGRRPLVTGEVSPQEALVFGLALGVAALAVLAGFVNVLSAALALAAILFYVVVYTMLLKRRTPQNIVWGGAAGCMPVLIGWAAVQGRLSWAAAVLFGVIFLWTPPHYWPLSLKFRDDYSRAGVPMLPVVAPAAEVSRKILFYAWATLLCSLLLVPLGGAGPVYTVCAVAAGGWLVTEAHLLLGRARAGVRKLAPMRLFHLSITYLTVLFIAVAVDPFVRF